MIQGWEPAFVSLAAGGLSALLGLAVLLRHPERGVNRAFFLLASVEAALLTSSALQTLSIGTETALRWTRFFWYFEPWLAAGLVLLALHMPTARGILLDKWKSRLIHAAILVPAAVLTGLYAMDHALFIQPARTAGGISYYQATAFGAALFGVRAAAAAVAICLIARRARSTPHTLQRSQLAWAQAALIVGLVPAFALYLINLVSAAAVSNAAGVALAIGAVTVNGGALYSLRPFDGSLFRDPDRQIVSVTYFSSAALALAVGLLGSRSAVLTFTALTNLAFPLILAYAVLKFDLFGLDLRVKQVAPHVMLGLLLAGAFALFMGVAANLSPAKTAGSHALAAMVLTSAAAVPLHRASTRLATRLGWTQARHPAALQERRLEIYRAAVENAVTRGEDVESDDGLVDLRERLALNTRDHRVMVQVVRDAMDAKPTAPTGPLREGDFVLRKYRVDEFLGSGSFGRALLATQVSVNRKVVIKEPHEQYRSRTALSALAKEARLAARVNHPHVVTLLDFEETESNGYLVFEYVAGGSLEARLKKGPLPRDEAYRIFRGVLEGLDAIHRARVVHMDLKPANVLVNEDDRAKISDFGIAREIKADVAATLGRSVGDLAHPGTLLYMAPEQVRGRRDPGPQADLYAAGAIFHEMLTGERYLDFPESPPLIQDWILYREPKLDDPRLTPAEQDLLQTLLAKAPADRPRTARDVIARLPLQVEGRSISTRSESVTVKEA